MQIIECRKSTLIRATEAEFLALPAELKLYLAIMGHPANRQTISVRHAGALSHAEIVARVGKAF